MCHYIMEILLFNMDINTVMRRTYCVENEKALNPSLYNNTGNAAYC